MKKFLWLLSVVVTMVVTHFATVRFGTFDFGATQTSEGKKKNLIVIVAVADEEVDGETNEAYFRQEVFGTENGARWPHAKEGKFFGHTGCGFSQKPIQLPQLLLPLWQ